MILTARGVFNINLRNVKMKSFVILTLLTATVSYSGVKLIRGAGF